MHLSVTIPSKLSVANFMGYLKGKSTLMIYDRYPELQSKWDKAFWARGYYVENIGNITYEAVGNISKASRRIKKRRFKKHRFISRPVTILETQPFGASSNIALWRTNNKPPVIKH